MAGMKCALPASLVGSILSFTVHGHDESELNRMRSISPKLQKAIDRNLILFNREAPLLEIRDHGDESLNGVWYLKNIKTNTVGGTVPGTNTVLWSPNPYRPNQNCVTECKTYTFTRELNDKLQELVVVSRRIVPKAFLGPPPLPDDPMWGAYRMDHQKESNYDLRLTFPLDTGVPLSGGNLVTSKKTIGQDLWSEKCERLCRFTAEQHPVRDQDRSSSKNPANYTPFEPASWIKLATPLQPVFADPKSEQERKERIAAREARTAQVLKESSQVLEEMLQGKSQEEKMEIMQTDEYHNIITQIAEAVQQARADFDAPETSGLDYDKAWVLGEQQMQYFRIRLFDTSGSLAP